MVAFPLSKNSQHWVNGSADWRRGLRTVYVSDFEPSLETLAFSRGRGDAFLPLNASTMQSIPFDYYGRVRLGYRACWLSGGASGSPVD